MRVFLIVTALILFTVGTLAQSPNGKPSPTPPPANASSATTPAAPKPEPVALTDDEAKQFSEIFEKLKTIGPQVDQAKQTAEKAIADFNAANATLRELQATRAALYFKALAERGLRPADYEMTPEGGISKKVAPLSNENKQLEGRK